MTKIISRFKRFSNTLRNAPLIALCACVSLAIETFAWGAILAENTGTLDIAGVSVRLAYPELVTSTAFSLAALVLSAAAAAMKADPRLDQRRRAWAPQLLAVVVLIAPVYYASSCLALQAQIREWTEYHGSDAEKADRDIASGVSPDGRGVDSQVRADAAESLKKGIRPLHPDLVHLIPSLLWVSLILGCNMLAIRAGWRSKPETPAETKARLAALRAAKAKATRERNKRQGRDDDTNVTEFRRA